MSVPLGSMQYGWASASRVYRLSIRSSRSVHLAILNHTQFISLNAGRTGLGPGLHCLRFQLVLLPARCAMLPKPGRQLRLLLRLQINAVVDPLNRLFVGTLRRFDFVSREEVGYLIAHGSIAETTGCIYHLRAREWPT